MRRLREVVRFKYENYDETNNSCTFHHDNAPTHTLLFAYGFLAKNSTNATPSIIFT